MKKSYLIIFALLLVIPFSVFAETTPKVLTVTAENSSSTINYTGTTEDGVYAVMCKLFNSSDEEIDMLSSSVDNNTFSGTFANVSEGTYNVGCARYEGGDVKRVEVIINSDDVEEKEYVVSDNDGNTITFKEEEGHTYLLSIIDYLLLTDEDLEELEIPKELYDEVYEKILDATKEEGTLLALYDIEVIDENDNLIHEGPFNIKIKITDDMKKYNSFKLIYVKDDFTLGETIELKVEGDYLVGTLPHLSTYTLVGNNVESSSNPTTGDKIYMWIGMLIISVIGLGIGLTYALKSRKSRVK